MRAMTRRGHGTGNLDARRIITPLRFGVLAFHLLLSAGFPVFGEAGGVIISEFMAYNVRTLADEDGDFSDWIEIHNPTTNTVNLAGYFLTDDPERFTKWAFPSVTLAPQGYLVVFASGKNRTSNPAKLHTNFQLDGAGDFLALVKPDGVTLADVYAPAFPNQRNDVSYGVSQNTITNSLLANSVPQILVPTHVSDLATNWAAPGYQPDPKWFKGLAPPALGFDTSQPAMALPNVARGGTALQSTTDRDLSANLGINGTLTDNTHTLNTDNAPVWQVALANDTAIYRIVLRNRTGCCQSRLRDITVEILASDGVTTNFVSPLLNRTNSGYVYPNGPASLEVDLVALTGQSVLGRIVRVRRTPDPALLGTDGQGGADEPSVLSLGEVEVYGADTSSADVNLARTGSQMPTVTQSSTYGAYTADLGINAYHADFTHTLGSDTNATWMLNLGRSALIKSVNLHNREDCCQSRLRDIIVQILDAATNLVFTTPLLNPENAGFTAPAGPADLFTDLSSTPIIGQFVRVRRQPDPDLSGGGSPSNPEEPSVLSLAEVTVMGADLSGYRPLFRTDLERMKGVNASAFLRAPFVLAAPSRLTSLTLNVRYDDGFAVWLNGVKVAERNAPATLTWNSAATAKRNTASVLLAEAIDLSGARPLLIAGTNVLAVQLLNASANDGNALFHADLISTHLETGSPAYLAEPTPGSRNHSRSYIGAVVDTQFGVERGFFDAPFHLEITSTTSGAQVWYSLDGSEPRPGYALPYVSPILIDRTSVVRARAFKDGMEPSRIDTHTFVFLDDVLTQATNGQAPANFPAAWGANRVDYGMDPVVIAKYTKAQWREALTQIPTLSLVTEMKNLFDRNTGIYANALPHGKDWERPGSIELLDPTNAVPGRFQEQCGLRIRGGYTRLPYFVKHSFRVFFRREYGAIKLVYPMFEEEGANRFDTFDLRTSQNYSWPRETTFSNGRYDTMVHEVFCRETLGAMGQPYRRSRYYHLYLNGQYWGLYETDERPEASYGETYFGGIKEDYDVVKCANHEGRFTTEITDGNFTAWSNLWTRCLSMLTNSANPNYFAILGSNPDGTRNPALPVMIDVDNLIDFMLEIFYSGDGDSPLSAHLANVKQNNWFAMRNRSNPDMGFRFLNSDCEHTLGAPASQVDRTGPWKDVPGSNVRNFAYSNPQYFHEELMLNAEYRLRFADHVQRHFFNGGALTPEAATNRFLRKAAQINKAMRAYEARWGDGNSAGTHYSTADWTNTIESIVATWFPKRTAVVLAQLLEDELYPPVAAPGFSQYGGDITNGFALTMSHCNDSGAIYFTLDGSDPRLVGGAVSGAALRYSNSVMIGTGTRVKARVLLGTTWSALVQADFTLPSLLPLRITEIMYHPPPPTSAEVTAGFTNAEDFEFIELRNVGPATIDLTGVNFSEGISFTFTGTLGAGERLLLVKNLAAFVFRYGTVSNVHGAYAGNLNNAGERLVLRDALGRPLHDFSYREDWYATTDGLGFSLVILDDTAPASMWGSKNNWRSSSLVGGSPGAANPTPPLFPLVVVNELLSRPGPGQKAAVELANLGTIPAAVGGWWLTDTFESPKQFQLPTNTVIPAGGFVVFTEDDFKAPGLGANAFNVSPAGGEVRLFSADWDGHLTGYQHGWKFEASDPGVSLGRHVNSAGADQFIAQKEVTLGATNTDPRTGPVIISEIMYHPPDLDAGDNTRDEFVELLNITTHGTELFDAIAPSNTWKMSGGVELILPTGVTLAAGERLLLVKFDPSRDLTALTNFRALYGVPANVQVFGPYSGKLDNSGEDVELKKPVLLPSGFSSYALVDRVSYHDSTPWPAGADGKGPSLHRLDSGVNGSEPRNWAAMSPTAGAGTVIQGSRLTVVIHGGGTVTPSLHGEVLILGASYTLTAHPAPGFSFGNWSGGITSSQPMLSFQMRSNLVLEVNFLPVDRPTVTISSTPPPTSVRGSSIPVQGTAFDTDGIAQVLFQIDSGPFQPASGTTNWLALAVVQPGFHTFHVKAINLAGNESELAECSLFFLASPLTLSTSGAGTAGPLTNGQPLSLGRRYTVRAVPRPGNRFTHWAGTFTSIEPVLTFAAVPDTALTAYFVSNQFPQLKGSYTGLLGDPANPAHESGGWFRFNLSAQGAFSGRLFFAGRPYPLSGRFDGELHAQRTIARGDTNAPIEVDLQIDPGPEVSGTILAGTVGSHLSGYRVPVYQAPHGSPLQGRYTLAVSGVPGAEDKPEGDGIGTVVVAATGQLTLAGTLADGTRWAQGVPLSADGRWPLYVPLYGGRGSVWSWVAFETNRPSEVFQGALSWTRPAGTTPHFYTNGFVLQTTVNGSRYTAPGVGSRVVSISEGVSIIGGGNFSSNHMNGFMLGVNNKYTNTGPDRVTVTFATASGLFSGTFTPAGLMNANVLRGVVLQKGVVGTGFVPGTNRVGWLRLVPDPWESSSKDSPAQH